jgi:hypothetical protein
MQRADKVSSLRMPTKINVMLAEMLCSRIRVTAGLRYLSLTWRYHGKSGVVQAARAACKAHHETFRR